MAGLPTVQVLLDAAANDRSFPYDITGFVSLDAGVGISTRGRSDELSAAQPVTCALTLDNTDGRFSLGAATYGALDVNRLIRVKVNGVNRFTGFVQSWPVAWPNGGPGLATAAITATDGRVWWSKRTLRSYVESVVLAGAPTAYWALDDPEGSLRAVESSGNNAGPLVVTDYGLGSADSGDGQGALPVVRFGVDAAPMMGSQKTLALRKQGSSWVPMLEAESTTLPDMAWLSFTLAVQSFVPDYASLVGCVGVWHVGINGSGQIYLYGNSVGIVGPVVTTGFAYHVGVSVAAGAVKLWVNGAAVGTATDYGYWDMDRLYLGLTEPGDVKLSHLAYGATPLADPGSYFTSIRNAQWLGTAADRGGQAIWQVANQADQHVPNSYLAMFTGTTPIPDTQIAGKTIANYVDEVAEAEGGAVIIDGVGEWRLTPAHAAGVKTSPDLTLSVDSDILDPATSIEVDLQRLVTRATGARVNDTQSTQLVVDAVAEAKYGESSTSTDYMVTTDAEVRSRVEWLVNTRKTVGPRVPALKLDLLSAPSGTQTAVLGLDVDSRIDITGMPAQTPGGTTLKLWVIGYSEQISASEWSWSANALDWTQYASVFVLDDATWGVMDDDDCRLGI